MSHSIYDWDRKYHNWDGGQRVRNDRKIEDEDKRFVNGKMEFRIARRGNYSMWEDYEGNREWHWN